MGKEKPFQQRTVIEDLVADFKSLGAVIDARIVLLKLIIGFGQVFKQAFSVNAFDGIAQERQPFATFVNHLVEQLLSFFFA